MLLDHFCRGTVKIYIFHVFSRRLTLLLPKAPATGGYNLVLFYRNHEPLEHFQHYCSRLPGYN